MIWYIGTVFFVVFIIGALSVSAYPINQRIIGTEAARKHYRQSMLLWLFLFLGGVAVTFLITALVTIEYGIQSFLISCCILLLTSLLNTLSTGKNAGALLIDIGRTPHTKRFFLAGTCYILMALCQTWGVFANGIPTQANLVKAIPITIFLLFFAAFNFAIGSGGTQFREKGIYSIEGGLIEWRRINSFRWEPSEPNILTLEWKPRSFLSFQTTGSIPIPERHREVVNGILSMYVSEAAP